MFPAPSPTGHQEISLPSIVYSSSERDDLGAQNAKHIARKYRQQASNSRHVVSPQAIHHRQLSPNSTSSFQAHLGIQNLSQRLRQACNERAGYDTEKVQGLLKDQMRQREEVLKEFTTTPTSNFVISQK
jgi:hypothetical protein